MGSVDPAHAVLAVRALVRTSRILERAGGDLSLAHYRVLAAVASGEERASRLAARLALGKPTISAAVDGLCGRGLLERGEVAADQRASSLTLTPAGRAALDGAERQMTEKLGELCECSPDPARMVEALVLLGSALDELQGRRDG
ncbi:MAG: MarR family winged helix-turn-helix transcriptional regulator [Actinomycetota bacterium]|nr:MarR family winged helix-turn-helix transcriptional regulator [Actinomycetota bacterium]